MKKYNFLLLLPVGITIILSVLLIYYQKKQDYISQQSSIAREQEMKPVIISAEIGNLLSEGKPPTAQEYNITISKISLITNKNYVKTKDEQFIYEAENIKGLGWMDKLTNSLGFEISFHNSKFILKNSKQTDEILNTLATGDINIKLLIQDQDEYFLNNNNFMKALPVVIEVNNITRGEVVNINSIIENNATKINGWLEINMSDYDIKPPAKDKIFEYDDRIKIEFEASLNLLN